MQGALNAHGEKIDTIPLQHVGVHLIFAGDVRRASPGRSPRTRG